MTGNANFTTPWPAAAVTTALTAYNTALANFNTAQQAAGQATTWRMRRAPRRREC